MGRTLHLFALAMVLALSPEISAGQDKAQPSEPSEETVTLHFLHPPGATNWLAMNTSRGAPTFPVRINGKVYCGLLDTGSTRTIVDLAVAREQGLKISDTTRTARALGVELSAKRVWAVPIEVEGQFRLRSSMFGIEMPDIDCADGSRLAFVLGSEFLNVMAVAIDNRNQKMLFHSSGSITPPAHHTKLAWQDNLVAVEVNGQPAKLKVDTGSSSALMIEADAFGSYFPEWRELDELPGSTSAAGRREKDVGFLAVPYSVGGIADEGTAKRIAANPDVGAGNLGYPFFAAREVLLDAGQKAIWLEGTIKDD